MCKLYPLERVKEHEVCFPSSVYHSLLQTNYMSNTVKPVNKDIERRGGGRGGIESIRNNAGWPYKAG